MVCVLGSILTGCPFCPTCPGPPFAVNIPDEGLNLQIRNDLGIPSGDILNTDLATLTRLVIDELVANLTGLEYCVNLRELHASGCGATDLTPLRGLPALECLDIRRMPIEDYGLLATLPALRELWVGTDTGQKDSLLSDISWLSSLPRLRMLWVWHSSSNISALAGLTLLEELEIRGQYMTDLGPLGGLTSLRELRLVGGSLTDLTPIASLTGLTALSVSGTAVGNLSALSSLHNLTHLSLPNNAIEDISPLSGLPELLSLDLAVNQVVDISILPSMPKLRELSLGTTWVYDYTLFDGISGGNLVSDLSPLADMPQLRFMTLVHNQIADLSPLADNAGFGGPGYHLDLRYNPLDLDSPAVQADLAVLEARDFEVLEY